MYSWYKKHGNVIGIRYAQGTKQQNLSYDIIEKFKIAYPTFQEQEKLNKFIALLDERIATQNKIIEDLKKLKSAIIEIEYTPNTKTTSHTMSWITGNAMVINTDEHQNKVCKRYLYHYLSAYNFNSIISGSGQPQIVRTPLENLEITLPSIFEQEQKAMLLDRIQAKIEISNRVLSLCQEQKQYLLEGVSKLPI